MDVINLNIGESLDLGNGITIRVDKKRTVHPRKNHNYRKFIATLAMVMILCTVCAFAFQKEEPPIEPPAISTPEAVEVVQIINEEPPIEPPVLTPISIPEETPQEPIMELVGSCRITAYCACKKCCGSWAENRPIDKNGQVIVKGAYGIPLTNKVSVAGKWPLGTKLVIPELQEEYFVVEDKTAEWIQEKYNEMTVDIYCSSHEEAKAFAREMESDWMDVYILVDDA